MPGKSSPSESISVTSFTEPNAEGEGKEGESQSPPSPPPGSTDSLSASPDLAIKYTDLPVFLQHELALLSEARKAKKGRLSGGGQASKSPSSSSPSPPNDDGRAVSFKVASGRSNPDLGKVAAPVPAPTTLGGGVKQKQADDHSSKVPKAEKQESSQMK